MKFFTRSFFLLVVLSGVSALLIQGCKDYLSSASGIEPTITPVVGNTYTVMDYFLKNDTLDSQRDTLTYTLTRIYSEHLKARNVYEFVAAIDSVIRHPITNEVILDTTFYDTNYVAFHNDGDISIPLRVRLTQRPRQPDSTFWLKLPVGTRKNVESIFVEDAENDVQDSTLTEYTIVSTAEVNGANVALVIGKGIQVGIERTTSLVKREMVVTTPKDTTVTVLNTLANRVTWFAPHIGYFARQEVPVGANRVYVRELINYELK